MILQPAFHGSCPQESLSRHRRRTESSRFSGGNIPLQRTLYRAYLLDRDLGPNMGRTILLGGFSKLRTDFRVIMETVSLTNLPPCALSTLVCRAICEVLALHSDPGFAHTLIIS